MAETISPPKTSPPDIKKELEVEQGDERFTDTATHNQTTKNPSPRKRDRADLGSDGEEMDERKKIIKRRTASTKDEHAQTGRTGTSGKEDATAGPSHKPPRLTPLHMDRSPIGLARLHLNQKLDLETADAPVRFFVEIAPFAHDGGASCRVCKCTIKISSGKGDRIDVGDHRVAVQHGSGADMWSGKTRARMNIVLYAQVLAEYYHVNCFEDVVDFSQLTYLSRIQPLNDALGKRKIIGQSWVGNTNLLNLGAVWLVRAWKTLTTRLVAKREGAPVNDYIYGDEEFRYHFHTSRALHEPKPINKKGYLYEEHGFGWDFLEDYLGEAFDHDLENLTEKHKLSSMLTKWQYHCVRHLVPILGIWRTIVRRESYRKLSSLLPRNYLLQTRRRRKD